jgi:acyl-CoA synthetase (NDP forming)
MLDNLRSVNYPGTVYPINPNRPSVGGVPSFARLSDIRAPVEAVAICVDQQSSLTALKEAVEIGAQAILVLGAGYAEAGGEGLRIQEEMAAHCRAAGVTLVGPNCLGPWSRLDQISYWLAPGSPLPLSRIGLVTQSGALAAALMEPLSYRGIALDVVATTGNEAGAGIADFLAHLADDPRIDVIGVVLESIRRPEHLLTAIGKARSRGKPVVGLLLGTSEAGRSAALAHTAALVGDGAVARTYLQQAGMLAVDELAELTEHLVLFSHYPLGLRAGLAVTTVSGGGSGLVADLADAAGAQLASLSEDTLHTISGLLDGKSVGNPLDVALAGDRPGVYRSSLAAVAADPHVGTVVVALNLPHAADPAGAAFYAEQVFAAGEAAAQGKDAVAFALVPGEPDPAVRTAAEQTGLPLLLGGRESLRAIAAVVSFGASPPSPTPPSPAPISSVLDPSEWDEFDVRASLASYGVPIAMEQLAHSADEACEAAERIGFPVALKIIARGLTHKSDHGGVKLGLASAGEVAVAYADLADVARELPGVNLRGIAVQQMVQPGTELLLAARSDAVFGRALILGWGGLWVESYPKPQIGTFPVDADQVWSLIERLFGAAMPRARIVADLDSLHAGVLAFAAFATDLPDDVEVVEINPLVLGYGPSAGVIAIDAALHSCAEPKP